MTIYSWIKALEAEVVQIARDAAQILELDEWHRYVEQKTIAGSGLLLIDLANASSMLSLEPEAS